ncbi:unnamed protein product, partial [Prorocentrum cordatum]
AVALLAAALRCALLPFVGGPLASGRGRPAPRPEASQVARHATLTAREKQAERSRAKGEKKKKRADSAWPVTEFPPGVKILHLEYDEESPTDQRAYNVPKTTGYPGHYCMRTFEAAVRFKYQSQRKKVKLILNSPNALKELSPTKKTEHKP